jgi:hypothetical protein
MPYVVVVLSCLVLSSPVLYFLALCCFALCCWLMLSCVVSCCLALSCVLIYLFLSGLVSYYCRFVAVVVFVAVVFRRLRLISSSRCLVAVSSLPCRCLAFVFCPYLALSFTSFFACLFGVLSPMANSSITLKTKATRRSKKDYGYK